MPLEFLNFSQSWERKGNPHHRSPFDFTNSPFEEGTPLSRQFKELPARSGIYALKHRSLGILYIGKTANIRMRFKGGHKSLGWAFIDRLDPDDVRIACLILPYQWNRVSYQLEQVMIKRAQPPYSDR